MSESVLAARRAGLEEAFFAKHNEELRQKMQEVDAQKFRKEALSAATGIFDEAVLARARQLGLPLVGGSASDFATWIATERQKFGPLVQASGARVE